MQRLALIQECASKAFFLRLGDSSPAGLAMTGLYIIASVLFLTLLFRQRDWLPGERRLWGAATVLLVLLTVNKQLDLQQSMIWTGRCVARMEGWFDQRAEVQRMFGAGVLAFLVVLAGWLVWSCRQALAANWRLLIGLALLSAFVALQIARFDQMTGSLGQVIGQLRLHRILEGTALCTLIWAGWRQMRG